MIPRTFAVGCKSAVRRMCLRRPSGRYSDFDARCAMARSWRRKDALGAGDLTGRPDLSRRSQLPTTESVWRRVFNWRGNAVVESMMVESWHATSSRATSSCEIRWKCSCEVKSSQREPTTKKLCQLTRKGASGGDVRGLGGINELENRQG